MKFEGTPTNPTILAQAEGRAESYIVTNAAGNEIKMTIRHDDDTEFVGTGKIDSSVADLHQFAVTLNNDEVTRIGDADTNLMTIAMQGKHYKVAKVLSKHLAKVVGQYRLRMIGLLR